MNVYQKKNWRNIEEDEEERRERENEFVNFYFFLG